MNNVCASSEHLRSSAHTCFIVMTLRLRRWSAAGTISLRSFGISLERIFVGNVLSNNLNSIRRYALLHDDNK